MKADVILRAHIPVKDAAIPVRALALAPVRVLALAPVLALARVAIISAQLPVLNLAKDVPDVVDAEIPAALDAQIVVRVLAKVVVLPDAEIPAAAVQDPVQQAVRTIVAGPAGINVLDRRLHRYIKFNQEENMRTLIIKVDSKEAEYIERLDYERGFTKDVLQRIIESHPDDAGIVNGEAFKAYQKQGVELDAQFKMAVTELEQKYIPAALKGYKIRWNLEYRTAELKVDILCNCTIEGIE